MTRRLTIDDLTAIAVPEQPALSPDGANVVYSLRTVNAETDAVEHSIHLVPAAGGPSRRLTRGTADSAPVFTPDGQQIAFLRSAAGPAQLWLLPADGGEGEQLTTLKIGAGAPVVSPDGTRIAFTAPVDRDGSGGDAPIVTGRVDYQADGAGMLRGIRQHLHLVDLESRTCRQVTDGDWHAGPPAFSPDGTHLVFAAGMEPDGDLTVTAPLYTLDITGSHAEPTRVGPADLVAAGACYTPDGSALIAVANPHGPEGHARLLRIELATGSITDLAAALDRNVMAGGPGYPGAMPVITHDGGSVLFAARDAGLSRLYSVPIDGGPVRPVLTAPDSQISGLSAAAGRAATVLTTATSFGEIAVLDITSGVPTVVTSHGENLSDITLFDREPRAFTISDGTTVHGWLIRDPEQTGPRPLLVDIHGGPHNAWNGTADEFHLYHQELAARGWAVLLINPRGSDGYGEAFFTATKGRWGIADAADFLEPIDALVAESIADPAKLAVTGYSYGGYMTCYLTSRDSRFAAAVAGGVVSDTTSVAGTSDAGHFLSKHEFGGQPWVDGAEMAATYDAMSPLTRVDKVTTPTLVIQGAADVRCPVGQAQEWFSALRERGVPTELVLYPGGSHLFILSGRPSHRIDFNRRVTSWVDRYAARPGGSTRPAIDADHWQRRLTTLAERHGVPGAALGILRVGTDGRADEIVTAAHGITNVATGVDVTVDTLFQIGSMSKVWTATIAMQLVDEGLLDLDEPIRSYLPEFTLTDPDAAATVTMRHLLTHTSGIDGDIFDDTGRGDDCLEKYTALLGTAAQNHPIGATWSYCNSGFSLAGRVIEKITGKTWDAAVAERLCAPLGLEHTTTLPEDTLLHRSAVGHIGDPGAAPTRAPVAMLPRSLGPAGLISSTVADVLAFARMHLTGGLHTDGSRVLSAASTAAMMAHEVDLPDPYSLGDSWGIGWIRFGWGDARLVGHDGNTIGQSAFLRVLPAQGLAITLLTNGGNTRDLYEDLYRELFAALADVPMAEPLTPPREPVTADLTPHLGTYMRAGNTIDILEREDGPAMRTTITGPLAALLPDPVEEYPLIALSDDLYLTRAPGQQTYSPVTFYQLPSGARYLHFGVRATPKVGD